MSWVWFAGGLGMVIGLNVGFVLGAVWCGLGRKNKALDAQMERIR